MKKLSIGIVIVAALIGGFFVISKPTSQEANMAATVQGSITNFSQVQSGVASGGQLLDVRTVEEYVGGHINGAINFTLQDLQAGKLPAGGKDQKIFVYCHSGNRSSQAMIILKQAGYTNVDDLGAITHVQDMGGKLVTGS